MPCFLEGNNNLEENNRNIKTSLVNTVNDVWWNQIWKSCEKQKNFFIKDI